jgi:hypothetical protein
VILTGVNPNPTTNLIGVRSKIEPALRFKQQRTVAKDNTITFEATVFQIPKKFPYRSFANKRIDVHVLLDGAVEFFYQKKIARFDSKTMHAFALYPTNGKREGFRYGPLSTPTNKRHELSP